jgi:hypothetical protein
MKRVQVPGTFTIRRLTRYLQQQGINVQGVDLLEDEGMVEISIPEAEEGQLLAALPAYDDEQLYDPERQDTLDLAGLIAGELDYLQGDIDLLQQIIPTIGGMTAAQVRTVVEGLAQRTLRLEQENVRILKALRYLFRQVGR